MNKLMNWAKTHTIAERKTLADKAKLSYAVLMQIAGAYRTNGVVSTTPETAAAIEAASIEMGDTIKREDLCQACGRCELAKVARGVMK